MVRDRPSPHGAGPARGEFSLRRPEGAVVTVVPQREHRCSKPRLRGRSQQARWPHDERDNPVLAWRQTSSQTRPWQPRRRQGNCAFVLPWCCPIEIPSVSLLYGEARFEFGENLFLFAGNLSQTEESTGSLGGLACVQHKFLLESVPIRPREAFA